MTCKDLDIFCRVILEEGKNRDLLGTNVEIESWVETIEDNFKNVYNIFNIRDRVIEIIIPIIYIIKYEVGGDTINLSEFAAIVCRADDIKLLQENWKCDVDEVVDFFINSFEDCPLEE